MQVCSSAHTPDEAAGRTMVKADPSTKVVVKEMAARQIGWLGKIKDGRTTWRPRKVYRISARQWLCNIDNQFGLLMRCAGLSFFLLKSCLPIWQDWRTWPYATIGLDMGSDGLSAMHSVAYFWQLNLEPWPDPSHLANRSVFQCLEAIGLHSLVLVGMVSWNLMFGPDKEDMRYRQLKEHLDWLYENSEPSQVPLFQHLAGYIIDAMLALGYSFTDMANADVEAWDYMRERSRFRRQGKKACLARFQALSATLKALTYLLSTYCLLTDLLSYLLHTCLLTCLLPTYLPTYLPTCLLTYSLPTWSPSCLPTHC